MSFFVLVAKRSAVICWSLRGAASAVKIVLLHRVTVLCCLCERFFLLTVHLKFLFVIIMIIIITVYSVVHRL